MGVTACWDDQEKTVVRYVLDEQWTWEDLFAAKKLANELMDTVAYPIGVIIDSTAIRGFAPNLMSQTQKGLRNKHPNTRVIVIVVTNPIRRTMIATLKAMMPLVAPLVETAPDVDEARRIIATRLSALAEPI